MTSTPAPVLILPGIGNSGPDHWQSHWERTQGGCTRVVQDEWDSPRCADWVARLDDILARQALPVVLAAHSSACALVAHWAAHGGPQISRVRGALLVGPSDPEGPNYPVGPVGFAPVPMQQLPFRSTVVASTNDPYVRLETAEAYASAWGSRLVVLEQAGHINVASGFGAWPEGLALLNDLRDDAPPAQDRPDKTGPLQRG